MKSITAATFLLTLLVLGTGCSGESNPQHADEESSMNESSSDRKAILETIERMNEAFGKGDIDGIMETYEPGAVVVGQPGQPMRGEATLRAMFQQFVEAGAQFRFGEHQVFQADDIAVHFTDWSMSAQGPDGEAVSETGLSVAVLRRQPDGAWRMVIDNPYGGALLAK